MTDEESKAKLDAIKDKPELVFDPKTERWSIVVAGVEVYQNLDPIGRRELDAKRAPRVFYELPIAVNESQMLAAIAVMTSTAAVHSKGGAFKDAHTIAVQRAEMAARNYVNASRESALDYIDRVERSR